MYAVGPALPGVFSDLPAIFAGNLAEDGWQGEQRVRSYFGARKIRTQTSHPRAKGTEFFLIWGKLLGIWLT